MDRQSFFKSVRLFLLLTMAALPLATSPGFAQDSVSLVQVLGAPQDQSSLKCDGTARGSAEGQGQMRSTSNCDRIAAAKRNAERRAAALKQQQLSVKQGGKHD